METHQGELAALATAFFWTVTAISFEAAGKRVGSLSVNLIRLFLGFVFLTAYSYIFRGMAFPIGASAHAWIWLSVSGVVSLTLGDFLLFRAFVILGSRISMLLMASVPPLTAIIGWLVMGETLTLFNSIGMALTVGGIAIVVVERNPDQNQMKFSRPVSGILIALGGALCQAVGLVLSKYGMGDYDPFLSTQIRIIAGFVCFCLIISIAQFWGRIGLALKDGKAMASTSLGALFGPFLGVSFSLIAIQHTTAGVAATIMSIVPVLIIAPAVLFFKEKVTFKEVVGAFVAVAGVAVLFLWE